MDRSNFANNNKTYRFDIDNTVYNSCIEFSEKALRRHYKDRKTGIKLQVIYEGGRLMLGSRKFCYISREFMQATCAEGHRLLQKPFALSEIDDNKFPFANGAYIEMTKDVSGFAQIMDINGKNIIEGARLKIAPEFKGEELLRPFYNSRSPRFHETVASFKIGEDLWDLFGKGRRPGARERFEMEIRKGSDILLITHPRSELPRAAMLQEDAKYEALKWVFPACQFHDVARALKDYKRHAPIIELGEYFSRVRTTEGETIMICACKQ